MLHVQLKEMLLIFHKIWHLWLFIIQLDNKAEIVVEQVMQKSTNDTVKSKHLISSKRFIDALISILLWFLLL